MSNTKTNIIKLARKPYTGDADNVIDQLSDFHKLELEKEIESKISNNSNSKDKAKIKPEVKISDVIELDDNKTKIKEIQSKRKSRRETIKEENKIIKEAEEEYKLWLAWIKDLISPSFVKIDSTKMQINDTYTRTFFVYAYPDFLESNWLGPVINWDIKFDMSIFMYPIESWRIMKYLKRRITELHSQRSINYDKWLVSDPALDAQIQDVEELRWRLARWQENYFHFSIYITVYADSEEQLKQRSNKLDTILSGRNILTKQAFIRMEQAFTATWPFAKDELWVYRNISTKWLSTLFPFTSSTLSQDDWILYWINTHNNSLIIYDRFNAENANMCVFSKSWGWKSFAVKLEILRSLMLWTDVLVIDPENEYKTLVDQFGWSYLNVSLNSNQRINPFDLPPKFSDIDLNPWDLLRWAIVSLIWLLKLMLWKITPDEEAILEQSIITTYSLKWLTFEDDDIEWKEVPVMRDLQSVLETVDWAKWLVARIDKYVNWIFKWLLSEQTNIDLSEWLQVFSVRDLDETIRPIAMYVVLNYIWSKVRAVRKERFLVVDEAWNIMQYEDSARFLFWLVKRARKYQLWVTTITQDVEDFMDSKYGKAIVTNSSIQLLFKQSTASIDKISNVFKLTEQEKYILLNSAVWQWLFFAWIEHVWIQVLASYFEEKVITGNAK